MGLGVVHTGAAGALLLHLGLLLPVMIMIIVIMMMIVTSSPVLPHGDHPPGGGHQLGLGGVLGQAVYRASPRAVIQLGRQPALHQLPATHLQQDEVLLAPSVLTK